MTSQPLIERLPILIIVASGADPVDLDVAGHQKQFDQANLPIEFALLSDRISLETEIRSRDYYLLLWKITPGGGNLADLREFLRNASGAPSIVVGLSALDRDSAVEETLLQLLGHGIRDFYFDDEPALLLRIVRRINAEHLRLLQNERDALAQLRTTDRFRELLEAAPDAIVEIDENGRIVLLNAVTEKLFGYSRTELLGKLVDCLVPDGLQARHAAHRAGYAHQPSTRPMGSGLHLQGRRQDGSLFPVEISLSPVKSAEGFRVSAIIRDVSERTVAEEQLREMNQKFTAELSEANRELEIRNKQIEQANRLKSEFLASMSHELRTPLHTIIGFSELLAEELEGPLNPKQKRFVGHVHKDSLHLMELINEILDISKIEAGKLELRTEEFNAMDALNEVLNSVAPLAAAKSIDLRRCASAPSIHADRVRFKQILYNLLSNAIKFTPEHGHVEAACRQLDSEVQFCVSDSGIGVPAEEQTAIFEKFHQVGSTTKGVREGTGLGLPIAKHLVEQHGGRLWVESTPGMGSRFYFTVPL